MQAKGKKLFKDFAIVLIGSFGSKILSFLMIPMYTSVLSTSDYGIVDLISTSVSLLYPILTLSISEALVRFVLEKDGKDDMYLMISFYIFVMGVVVMVPGAKLVSMYLFRGKYYLYILCTFITVSASSILGQYVRGKEKMIEYSISGVLSTFVFLSLNIFFLIGLKAGVEGYLMANIISSLASIIYLGVRVKILKHLSFRDGIDRLAVKRMVSYSFPLIMNSISWWIVLSSDKYVLLYFCGTSANGIYSVAQKIPSLLMTITTLFISAWQISSVADFGSEESACFFSDVLKKYQGILILTAIIIGPFVRFIASLMFAKEFYIAWKYVFVLLIANIFYSIGAFQGTVYTAAMKTKVSFYTTLVGAISNVVLNILLIPKYEIMGACIATALSYYVVMVIRQININTFFSLKFKFIKYHLEYGLVLVQGILVLAEDRCLDILAAMLIIPVLCMEREFIVEALEIVKGRIKG